MKTMCWCTIVILLMTFVSLQSDGSHLLYDDSEVSSIEISVDPVDLEWMYNNVWSDSLHEAVIHFTNPYIDEIVEDVGFRLRGNTSRLAWKKSFKLSFNDFVPGREFYDIDKMNLNGEHNDPSIIRSKLCWDIYQTIGMISSRAAYTSVYINEAYYGLYISIEHIDDEFLDKNFTDDSGNLWKCNYLARLDYLGDDPDLYKFTNNGNRVYKLIRNEEEDDYSQLARLIDVINNTPSDFLADSLETILDLSGVLKYFVVDVLTGSWDDYWYGKNNYYIYHEPAIDKFYIIPYDYDNTFGVDWANIDWTQRDIYQFKHPDANRPLADQVLSIDQYRNLYTHFLEFYNNELYELSLWEARIDNLKNMITPFAEADSFRTYDYGFTIDDFHDSYSDEGYLNQHVKKGLKEFINQRYESISEQIEYLPSLPILYEPDWYPAHPQPQDTVFVSISAFSDIGVEEVYIEFYPEDGQSVYYPLSFEPQTGTHKVEDADRWTSFIPPLENLEFAYFRIIAIDLDGEWQDYPRNHRIYLEPAESWTGSLFINEFLALNDNVNFDEASEYDDWLELYNASSQAIDLTGLYLSDDEDDPAQWQFPPVYISPFSYLLIWCDDDTEQGPLHANFKLSGDGEDIILSASDGITLIDVVSFNEQQSDVSYGRSPDAADYWDFMTPTPDAPNVNLDLDDSDIPLVTEVKNFPNPFNPSTNFEFSLNRKSMIKLDIYNLRGQKIITLINEELPSGDHQIIWNGTDENYKILSSGIYFYQLTENNVPQSSKKCILLK